MIAVMNEDLVYLDLYRKSDGAESKLIIKKMDIGPKIYRYYGI
jgi:hypothetical protein